MPPMADPPERSSWQGRGSNWQGRTGDMSMSYPRPAFRLASPSQPRLNRLALASVIFALLWGFGIGSLLAVAFGIVAKRQIRRRRQSGRTLASVGIVLGAIGVVTTAVAGLLVVFFDDSGTVGDEAAAADIAVAPCAVDPTTGRVTATVTVTNSTDIASNYLITLDVADGTGASAGEAYATASLVPPGAAVQVVATSDIEQLVTPVCSVATVTRYAAPGATSVPTVPAAATVAPTAAPASGG